MKKIMDILHNAIVPAVPEICNNLKNELIEELVEFVLTETKYQGNFKEIIEKVHARLDERIKQDAP